MKKDIQYLLLVFLIIIGVLVSCNKDVTPPAPVSNNSLISFFNASYALRQQSAYNKVNLILVDSKDTAYSPAADLMDCKYPYFNQGDRFGYSFPLQFRTQWVQYMRLASGAHNLYLVDTAKFIRDSTSAVLSEQYPVDVFYGDNFGKMKTLVLKDVFTPAADSIGVRIVNLSPSSKRVYITVNNQVPAVFPKDSYYGDHTAYLSLPVSRLDTLKFKVFPVGESSDFMARTTLEVVPGHAYTLIICGYDNDAPASYTDERTGKTVGINSNYNITAIKNF